MYNLHSFCGGFLYHLFYSIRRHSIMISLISALRRMSADPTLFRLSNSALLASPRQFRFRLLLLPLPLPHLLARLLARLLRLLLCLRLLYLLFRP